jgi:hypothetical protein
MKKVLLLLLLLMLFANEGVCREEAKNVPLSESSIKKKIIAESIASYSGNCPCPYSTMRNGRACGGRSAYSKPGGAAPVCYEKDVSQEMVNQWRRDNNQASVSGKPGH